MPLSEAAIDYLEAQIPILAEAALTIAYWGALSSGFSVLIAEDGALLEVFPDGTSKFIKNIPPRIPIEKGLKLVIK